MSDKKKNNIILTGMPGSGKSTVGVILAKQLCMDFVDTDVLIQRGEGMSLQALIDRDGPLDFLKVEARYVLSLDVTDTVIAPGGSVILNDVLMNRLREAGIAVFLDVPIDTIRARIDFISRGTVRGPGETLDDVWRIREPLYRKHADLTIDCKGLSQMEVAREIARRFSDTR